MLKIRDVKLTLISDANMHQLIKKCIRGNISYVLQRQSKAYHKYIKSYDKYTPSKYMIHEDAKNLYGLPMS